jgi:hypothetical protein
MDIQKVAAWANVGSFAVGCIALYFVFPSQHPQMVEKGAATQAVNPLHPSMWIFLITLLVAGLLHLTAAVIQRKGVHTLAPLTAASSSLVPASVSSQSTQVGGRNFVGASITPEYLVGLFKEHTSIQARKLIEPFTGKWMRVSGQVNEVISSSSDLAQVTFSGRGLTSDLAGIYMYFRTKDSIERLTILRRGDSLTIVGKIRDVSAVQIDLDTCELEG